MPLILCERLSLSIVHVKKHVNILFLIFLRSLELVRIPQGFSFQSCYNMSEFIPMSKKVSLKDVAEAAGVSTMTVSRVINKHPRVLPKTSERIMKVIDELGYSSVPSLRRRGRRSRAHSGVHTGQIALVLLGTDESFAHNPVIGKSFHGLRKYLNERQMSTLLVPVQDQEKIPDILDRKSIDGMIVTGEYPEESFKKYFSDMPIVYLHCLSNEQEFEYDQVMPNNVQVAKLAAQEFLQDGCDHCAFFDPSPNHPEFAVRGQKFKEFFEQAGGRVDMYLDEDLSASPESAEQDVDRLKFSKMIKRFLADDQRASAVFLPSDTVTAIFYRELRENGQDPADYKIISCNNEQPYLEGLFPSPKSIDIHPEKIGVKAAERLMNRLSNSDMQVSQILVEASL